jgi:hypothetical protein
MESSGQYDPLPVLIAWPERDAPIYARINDVFSGDISTSGGMLKIWEPSAGTRFILKGGYLCALVSKEILIHSSFTQGADVLMLLDGDLDPTACLYPLGIFADGDRADTVITNGIERFDLGNGHPSAQKDNALYVGANVNLSEGEFRIVGTVWGDEVPI